MPPLPSSLEWGGPPRLFRAGRGGAECPLPVLFLLEKLENPLFLLKKRPRPPLFYVPLHQQLSKKAHIPAFVTFSQIFAENIRKTIKKPRKTASALFNLLGVVIKKSKTNKKNY